MNLNASEVEGLFEELGARGVTVVVQIEHLLLAAGQDPWKLLMTGSGVRDGGIQTRGCATFRECLEIGLGELQDGPGDWEWLDLYR